MANWVKNMLTVPWHQHVWQGLRKDQMNHEQGCVNIVSLLH